LLGTVREYAAERLAAAGEVRVMTDRHAAWFMANAETAAGAVDPETFVRWAGTEHENLGAALDWYLGQGAQPGLALALAAPLWVYWYQSGRSREGLAWMRRALDAAPADLTISRGLGLRGAASLARSSGDLAVARELGEECLGVYRALGDDAGIASALNGLGATAQTQGDLEGAVRYGLESVEVGSRTPNLRGLAAAQCNLGIALRCVGRRDEADAMFAISLKGFRELGARRGEAAVLNNLAIAARQRRQNARARQLALEALRIYSDLDFAEGMADAVEAVAALEITGGRAAEGLRLYEVAGQERGLIGSVIVTPDERADRAVALAAAIKSLGSSNVQALLASTSNLRLRGVVDELLATHAAGC
jgi:tetratricopeptide (TPR) repeat protein